MNQRLAHVGPFVSRWKYGDLCGDNAACCLLLACLSRGIHQMPLLLIFLRSTDTFFHKHPSGVHYTPNAQSNCFNCTILSILSETYQKNGKADFESDLHAPNIRDNPVAYRSHPHCHLLRCPYSSPNHET